MRKSLSIVFVGLSGLAVLACGGNGSGDPFSGTGGSGGAVLTCASLVTPPPDCDKACTSDSQCEASFCQNGKCVANCTATEGCGTGSTCNTTRGRCVPNMGTGGTGGTGNTGGNACQSVTITPTRSIPNVMFLVDQSGTMEDPFGGGDRWQGAHSAITSIVSERASVVNFGLTTYTSDNGNANLPCPRLPTQIPFGQSEDIVDPSVYVPNYPSGDGADTPTGDSIDALVNWIQDPNNAPPADEPTIIVLATDGLPDSCECPNGFPPDPNDNYCEPESTDPKIEAVNAAAAAHAQGIDVFPLWVGQLDSTSTRNHLQDVANAGVDGTGTVWVGDDPTSLSNAFQSIISDSISCDIQMDERFDDETKACEQGDVRLNGTPLACSETDGWRVKPGVDDIIELVGSACDTFKSGDVTFTAEFPCGAIVVE